MGVDRDDLVRNALTMQQIYDHDYNFAAVPLKPRVTAVPGHKRVTLYWDKSAERSRDPIYGYDFEGYVIYRATDPGFLESYIGTDAYGNASFNKPIAQFDLADGLKGTHPVGRDGIQFNMGNDTGLQYTFVDSGQTWMGPVENGQTYYYAVCSYDKGYFDDFFMRGLTELDSLQAKAPAICEKKIQFDASGTVTFLDVNTVRVIPNSPAAGYVNPPDLTTDNGWVTRVEGRGTGEIKVQPLDPIKIINGATYEISFDDTSHFTMNGNQKVYTDTTLYIKDLKFYTQTVSIDTDWVVLKHNHLVPTTFSVKLYGTNTVYQKDIDYAVNLDLGGFKALANGSMPYLQNKQAEITYQYYPVYDSPFTDGEDKNDYFDGLRVLVKNHVLEPNNQKSHWLEGDELQFYMAKY